MTRITLSVLAICMMIAADSSRITNAAERTGPGEYTNSVGMEMVRIKPGSFMMGADSAPLPDEIISLATKRDASPRLRFRNGDYDETPRHKVTITKPFYIGRTEVTVEQFRKFRPGFPGFKAKLDYNPYVSAISWDDAVAFCKWLSEKEGKTYRLPTEAEWEYCCRAGTDTPFSSGTVRPEHETANQWGIRNMHTGVREWCLDWHGIYPETPQTDPIGPAHGWVKVVRGGGLDYLDERTMSFYFGRDYEAWDLGDATYYARSSNRAAVPPNLAPPPGQFQVAQLAGINPPKPLVEPQQTSPYRAKGLVGGHHYIGFRVVQAPMPETKPLAFEPPFLHCCVKQSTEMVKQGPGPEQPYYRVRLMFPKLTAEQMVNVGWKIGVTPGLGTNQHNAALVALDNGDLIACYYNGFSESDPDLCIGMVRLRFGSDQWDMPSAWPDLLDGNDASPFLWNDNGTIWLGWGCPHMTGGYPFHYIVSKDNGATWGPIQNPVFESWPGGYGRRQPINSHFRGPDNTMYIAFDAWGSASGLWASRNNAKTWFDPRGRVYGLHGTFVLLDDNTILAYGTRNRNIEGFCPRNVSGDWGKSWQVSRSPLPAQGGGRNPVIIKLSNGRLLYASDFGQARDPRVKGFTGAGPYVGLSEDNGQTWRIRKLVAGDLHDGDDEPVKFGTVGYVGATQTPNGMIHMVTTRNRPYLHVELNESWILADDTAADAAVAKDYLKSAVIPATIKQYHEYYPSGKLKVSYAAGIDQDGRYVLHGKESWYYQDGQKHWEANYQNSRKSGDETYWFPNGRRKWNHLHNDDGTSTWTHWWSNGQIKATSTWRKLSCQGVATIYSAEGQIVKQVKFPGGEPVR